MRETKLLLAFSWMPRQCLLQTGSQFFVFCLSLSSFLVLPFFFLCPPFILIAWAVICEVSRTRRPVCISRGCLRMYGTWGRVSGAAERMCPGWQGLQIYGVDVPLHFCPTDEKIPLFFFPHKHPPYPECTPPLPFLRSIRHILHAMLFRWMGSGSHKGERKEQRCGVDLGGESRKKVLLCNMSYQSSMDMGDPLGDRFWLSPKKGKWRTYIDPNVMQGKGGRRQRVNGSQHWSEDGLCYKEVWPHAGNNSFFTLWNLGS